VRFAESESESQDASVSVDLEKDAVPGKENGFVPEEKELVVASMHWDDVSWLDEFFGDWKKNVYVVNNASAELTVPKNKGREAMPFLTYVKFRRLFADLRILSFFFLPLFFLFFLVFLSSRARVDDTPDTSSTATTPSQTSPSSSTASATNGTTKTPCTTASPC
jgi:hypothetical protein